MFEVFIDCGRDRCVVSEAIPYGSPKPHDRMKEILSRFLESQDSNSRESITLYYNKIDPRILTVFDSGYNVAFHGSLKEAFDWVQPPKT